MIPGFGAVLFSRLSSRNRHTTPREGDCPRTGSPHHDGFNQRRCNLLLGHPVHEKIRTGASRAVFFFHQELNRLKWSELDWLVQIDLDRLPVGINILDSGEVNGLILIDVPELRVVSRSNGDPP